MRALSDFDLSLHKGMGAEALVLDLFGGDVDVEVKRDYIVSTSGNIGVEFRWRGEKSGIALSKAHYYAFVFDGDAYGHEVILFIRTERLKAIGREVYATDGAVPCGDGKQGRMVLIPVTRLTDSLKGREFQPTLA